MSGANTLLSLIPTAGVLIGAPAKELWVLYKLCPLAGFLAMLLSLGGNIVPADIKEYENVDAFSYQGMVAVPEHHPVHPRHYEAHIDKKNKDEVQAKKIKAAEKFANQVMDRAMEDPGVRPSRISAGVYWRRSPASPSSSGPASSFSRAPCSSGGARARTGWWSGTRSFVSRQCLRTGPAFPSPTPGLSACGAAPSSRSTTPCRGSSPIRKRNWCAVNTPPSWAGRGSYEGLRRFRRTEATATATAGARATR